MWAKKLSTQITIKEENNCHFELQYLLNPPWFPRRYRYFMLQKNKSYPGRASHKEFETFPAVTSLCNKASTHSMSSSMAAFLGGRLLWRKARSSGVSEAPSARYPSAGSVTSPAPTSPPSPLAGGEATALYTVSKSTDGRGLQDK